MTAISTFVHHRHRHFNAADACKRHLEGGGEMFITMAGVMSTAEPGLSLAGMIRQEKVHAICCSGANLENYTFKRVAHDHYLRIARIRRDIYHAADFCMHTGTVI